MGGCKSRPQTDDSIVKNEGQGKPTSTRHTKPSVVHADQQAVK